MHSIDEIMGMLDWNNPPEVQETGRVLSQEIKCINVFLQPLHKEYGKNVWGNCAQILSDRTDMELYPYIPRLLEWVEDMNWPGAQCIWRRLADFENRDWLNYWLDIFIKVTEALDEEIWLDTLISLRSCLARKEHSDETI